MSFEKNRTRYSLVIASADAQDAGVYEIVAKNSMGSDKSSVNVVIDIPPVVVKELENKETIEGNKVEFECEVYGLPNVHSKWYKNTQEIANNAKYDLVYEKDNRVQKLILNNSEISDAGTYSVITQNKSGKCTTKSELNVLYEPKFKLELKDTIVVLKKTVILEVEVLSNPQSDIKWFKDDVELNNLLPHFKDGRCSLVERKRGVYQVMIKNAKEEDAGTYSVIVSNKVGQSKSIARLTVLVPPVFIQKMDKIEAVEKYDVDLIVEISGYPKPKVVWSKGTNEIIADKNPEKYVLREAEGKNILTIKSVRKEDVGQYQCQASNEAGQASSTGKLTIHPLTKPKFIKELNPNIFVPETLTFELSAQATGIPFPKLMWYKNDTLIDEAKDNFIISTNVATGVTSLKTKSIANENSGIYKLVASNMAGESVTSSDVLVSGYPPRFLNKPEKITCLENETAVLGAAIDGKPIPKVQWSLKGKPLTDGSKYKFHFDESSQTHLLEILNCTSKDKGTYQLTAKNPHGSETVAVTLMITDKPEEVNDLKAILKNVDTKKRELTDENPDWGSLKKTQMQEKQNQDDQLKYKLKPVEKKPKEDTLGEQKIIENTKQSSEFEPKERTPRDVIQPLKAVEEIDQVATIQENQTQLKSEESISQVVEAVETAIQEQAPSQTLETTEKSEVFVCDQTAEVHEIGLKASVLIDKENINDMRVAEKLEVQTEESTSAVSAIVSIETSKTQVVPENKQNIALVEENKIIEQVSAVIEQIVSEKTEICKEESKVVEAAQKSEVSTTENATELKTNIETTATNMIETPKQVIQAVEFEEAVVKYETIANVPEKSKEEQKVLPEKPLESVSETAITAQVKIEEKKPIEHPKLEETKVELIEKVERNIESLRQIVADEDFNKLVIDDGTDEKNRLILIALNNAHVEEGETAIFECAVSNENARVCWFMAEKPVRREDNCIILEIGKFRRLVVKDCTRRGDNSTLVECRWGSITTSAHLWVVEKPHIEPAKKEAPKFTQVPKDMTIVQDVVIKFDCVIESISKPKVSWFLNDFELSSKDNVKFDYDAKTSTHSITIPKVSSVHNGVFSIRASNANGETVHTFNLNVLEPPKIKGKLENITVKENEEAKFSFKLTGGKPKPSVKWYKDEEEIALSDNYNFIEQEDNVELVVKSCSLVCTGSYYAKIINDAGHTTTNKAQLVVNTAPKFIKLSEVPEVLKKDESIKLEAIIEAHPKPSINWQRNGRDLSLKDQVTIEKDAANNRYTLIINKINSIHHLGVISLKASNSVGIIQHDFNINVHDVPVILSKLENLNTNNGQVGEFTCEFKSNPVITNVKWTRNDEQIFPSEKYDIINTEELASLKINNCSSEDSNDLFQVTLKNDLGEVMSNKVKLIVNCGPVFIEEPQNSYALRDKEAKFECVVSGIPKPSVIWLFNGKELTARDGAKIDKEAGDRFTLSLRAALSGTVTARANNNFGASEKSCELIVQETPKLLNKLENLVVNENEQAEYCIKYSGIPTPSIQWFKEDTELLSGDNIEIIVGENESKLVIKSCISSEHSGSYYIKAINEHGQISSNRSSLTINRSPKFVTHPKDITVVQDSSVRFETTIDALPKAQVSWFYDGRELTLKDGVKFEADQKKPSFHLFIPKVGSQNIGNYTVRAKNSVGQIEHSFTLDIYGNFLKSFI